MSARRSALPELTSAVVIGGGVVGCALVRELARTGVETILLEAEPDVGEGASKANSAILHNGFDARPGTIEAHLLRRAAELWPETLADLAVPLLRVGALMLARSSDELDRLRHDIAVTATGHGVETELLDASALRALAPYVTTAAVGALHVPDEAIVDPFWLTRAYAEAAIALGAQVWTDARVTAIAVDEGRVRIELGDGRRIAAEQAFDCAGVCADEVAALAGDRSFTVRPRKGQFLLSEKTFDVDRIILPIPGPLGKGMLVTPIVFGGLLLGPTAEDIDDKTDRATDEAGRRRILEACRGLVPDVDLMDPIRQFAGVRAVSSTGDFIIRPSTAGDRLAIVAGIRSTGISASPAIAQAAVELVASRRGWSHRNRRTAPAPRPAWRSDAGPIVCVCRSVASAEVAAALDGPLPPRTVDGLKRRCGAGFGDCQSNHCLPEVIDRLAAARGEAVDQIRKGSAGSWLVTATTTGLRPKVSDDLSLEGSARTRDGDVSTVDVVVVGGGLAGIGAALAIVESGLDVLVVDRGRRPGGAIGALPQEFLTPTERDGLTGFVDLVREGLIRWWPGATTSGLRQLASDWGVDVQATSAFEIRAGQVVLATGGYVAPREHLSVAGPRPSGIMTADFAFAALDRGWLPAHRAVVVGRGRLARGLAERLAEAGVVVVAQVDVTADLDDGLAARFPVHAVRGGERLEAVAFGEDWLSADGLVLAHGLRPASFLLRGLGIGDDRPGIPMPAAPDGSLPMAGLWAAGTCAVPDVDHRGSLASGRAVGAAVAGSRLRLGATF